MPTRNTLDDPLVRLLLGTLAPADVTATRRPKPTAAPSPADIARATQPRDTIGVPNDAARQLGEAMNRSRERAEGGLELMDSGIALLAMGPGEPIVPMVRRTSRAPQPSPGVAPAVLPAPARAAASSFDDLPAALSAALGRALGRVPLASYMPRVDRATTGVGLAPIGASGAAGDVPRETLPRVPGLALGELWRGAAIAPRDRAQSAAEAVEHPAEEGMRHTAPDSLTAAVAQALGVLPLRVARGIAH